MYVKKAWLTNLCFAWTQLVNSSPVQPKDRLLPVLPPDEAIAKISSPVTNLTWGPVPLEFKVRPDVILPTQFPEEAAFINIVHAMKDIAHGDFQGTMPAQDFSTARYPEPHIRLTATLGSSTLKREYVIWGLYGALLHMYNAMGFQVSHFTLLWDDEEVGGIGFGFPFGDRLDHRAVDARSLQNYGTADDIGPPASEKRTLAGTELAGRANTPGSDKQKLNTTLTDLASRLSVTFTWAGRTMDKDDMFLSIIWTLVMAAMHPSYTRIRHLWTPSDQESSCRFTSSATTRKTSPFLQYFWIVEAVAKAADYLVETRTYRQLSFVMKVDEVVVGRSLLFYREDGLGKDVADT
ncbi:MAG: hypothetical protein L6R38_007204 [Xanthoria sp. 2 TBL-2021]|nr:MAG: hypothetical protein L6R38_007204 [Xanthoria sp. 2 TBL-2021]